jgi:hypothetical protein
LFTIAPGHSAREHSWSQHMRIPRQSLIALIILGAATTSLSLGGCVQNFANGTAEDQLEQALEDQSDGALDADLDASGNAEVPADWPDSIPLPPGDAFQSSSFGSLMSISTNAADRQAGVVQVDAIIAAGFETVEEQVTAEGGMWKFTNGEYNVTYTVLDSGNDDGTVVTAMSVQKVES